MRSVAIATEPAPLPGSAKPRLLLQNFFRVFYHKWRKALDRESESKSCCWVTGTFPDSDAALRFCNHNPLNSGQRDSQESLAVNVSQLWPKWTLIIFNTHFFRCFSNMASNHPLAGILFLMAPYLWWTRTSEKMPSEIKEQGSFDLGIRNQLFTLKSISLERPTQVSEV